MQLRPRFVGRLGLADGVTVANAVLGFVAVLAVTVDPGLAARLILLASIADGLDGVIARIHGSTPLGEYVDSLADVASFSVAPAVFVFWVVKEGWGLSMSTLTPRTALVVTIPALFVAAGVVRLGMYTAYDLEGRTTEGVQTTLAATYLAGVTRPAILLGVTAVFTYLMVTGFEYPELSERDALAMGVIQFGAVVAPAVAWRLFPRALTVVALLYLMLAPDFYPRTDE
jgi:CDP-diacylglycerol--serine O-phosphatidyltransferase